MAAFSVTPPFDVFPNTAGDPLEDGFIYLGTAGLNPEANPINAYWDAALSIPAAQPVRTINGFPSRSGTPGRLFVDADDYSITVRNKNGSLVYSSLNSTDRIPFSLISGQLDSERVDYLAPFGGSSSRTLEARLSDLLSIKDFGAVGDGVADDTPAFQSALASGRDIYFPDGTYRVVLTAGANFTPSANTALIADDPHQAVLAFESATSSYKSIFNVTNDGFSIKGLGSTFSGVASDSTQFISLTANDLTVVGCKIDGGNVAGSNLYNFIEYLDVDTSNIRIVDNEISGVQRVQLRSNTRTGNIRNVLYQGNYIHDLGQGGVQFNVPTGSAKNIRIVSNHFEDFTAGTEQIFCGGASVQNMVIASNVFEGDANECVHLEEEAENIAITGNEIVANADGIFLTDNNIGGTFEQPQNIVISSNVFFDGSLTRANRAIRGVADGTGIQSFESVTITGNSIKGYEQAVSLDFAPKLITGNTIINCDFGCRINHATPTVTDNAFINVATALYSVSNGGLFGNNSFKDCTTVATTLNGEKLSMTGFKVYVDVDTNLPATTTTNVNLGIDVGAEFWGHATAQVYVSPTSYQHRISQLEYDGATVTDTERQRNGSGSVAFSGFVNNAGELAVALNNTAGSAATLRNISVQFDGMWTSST